MWEGEVAMVVEREGGGGRLVDAERYRLGRNYIAVGDTVRIRPTPGRRNGFRARVRAIKLDGITGEAVEVEVFGGVPVVDAADALRMAWSC